VDKLPHAPRPEWLVGNSVLRHERRTPIPPRPGPALKMIAMQLRWKPKGFPR
jgi:hypothetical protein